MVALVVLRPEWLEPETVANELERRLEALGNEGGQEVAGSGGGGCIAVPGIGRG